MEWERFPKTSSQLVVLGTAVPMYTGGYCEDGLFVSVEKENLSETRTLLLIWMERRKSGRSDWTVTEKRSLSLLVGNDRSYWLKITVSNGQIN